MTGKWTEKRLEECWEHWSGGNFTPDESIPDECYDELKAYMGQIDARYQQFRQGMLNMQQDVSNLIGDRPLSDKNVRKEVALAFVEFRPFMGVFFGNGTQEQWESVCKHTFLKSGPCKDMAEE